MQTRKKSARRGLLVSATSLLLSVAMLVGTTFAWFTDSVSSGTNTIKAGNLDIEVEYSKDGTGWSNLENTSSLFGNDKWEPGHTEFVYLKVKNAGSLDLNYKVMVSPVSENGGISVKTNETFKLSDYLVFGTTTPEGTCPNYGTDEAGRAAARAAVGDTKGLNEANLTQRSSLTSGKEAYLALVVYMPETVGNEANAKPGTTPPSIDLGIKVIATQKEAEQDSFGNTYDKDAVDAPEYVAGAYYDYFEAVNVMETADSSGNFTVTKTDSNSGIIASASGTATAGAEVNLLVMKSSEAEKNFTITVEDGHELNGYDIKVSGQTEGSLVQGKLYVGTGLENFKFYHDGNLMVKVQYVNNLSLTDNQYSYNPADGYVYFATTTFSPFQATYKAPVAAIGTAVYGTVADAFAAVKSNETITLLKSSVGNGIQVLSGKEFTVDFHGFTYDVNGTLVGSSGTETNSLQLLKDSTITFKNGTLTSSISNYASQILIQNYSNLTLDNMIVSAGVPFDYIVSNNNGNVVIKDTTINAAEGKVAFDVCRYADYIGPSVTVEGNSVINGKVEISSSGEKEGATHQLNVTGGTFNGKIYFYNESPNFVGNITGGTFATDVNDFCANGYGAVKEGSTYKVIEGNFAKDAASLKAMVNVGGTVYLAKDIDLTEVLEIRKSVTIKGQGHNITNTANRVIRILQQPNLDVKMYDTGIISKCTASSDVRGISFDNTSSGTKLLLDGCTVSASFYAINMIPGSSNLDITIKNGTVAAGWAAINCYANNSTFTIENSTLRGINDKGESAWNHFATIVFDGNGLQNADNIGKNGSNNTMTIKSSTIYASSNSSNKQAWLAVQYGAWNENITVDAETKIIDANDADQMNNITIIPFVGRSGNRYTKSYDTHSTLKVGGNSTGLSYNGEIDNNALISSGVHVTYSSGTPAASAS